MVNYHTLFNCMLDTAQPMHMVMSLYSLKLNQLEKAGK